MVCQVVRRNHTYDSTNLHLIQYLHSDTVHSEFNQFFSSRMGIAHLYSLSFSSRRLACFYWMYCLLRGLGKLVRCVDRWLSGEGYSAGSVGCKLSR